MRILIADDNEMVRRGLTELLSSETGWEVCGEAINGAETLRKAQELLPDLILLDVSMPDMNGLEAARLLRDVLHEVKIIIISQHDQAQLLPSAINAGACACADKSFLNTDLLPTIRNIEGQSKSQRAGAGSKGGRKSK
jgi:DNA-binding NarL/FixJ family response regulator